MNKKHFIALANAIRDMHTHDDGESLELAEVIRVIGDCCQSQNPRFNRQRWEDYIAGKCGSNGGKVKAAA